MTMKLQVPTPAPRATLVRFPAARVRSLVWDADALVDWVDGGVRWTLLGQSSDPAVRHPFSFDMATTLPGSGYSVIYKRLGTKGLVLKDGKIVREIDRSYYHAEVYEFPIALFRLPSGRPAIVHCPEDYCRLRIDDLETGEPVTSATAQAGDFFHSRLSVSPDGRWLASAGWMWHPVDDVALYDLHAALADGEVLDRSAWALGVMTEGGNAAGFDARSRLLVTADMTGFGDDETGSPDGPSLLRLAPALGPETAERRPLAFDSSFMAVGDDHLLMLAGTPAVVCIATGQVVASWPDIAVRAPASSMQAAGVEFTPVACDLAGGRVAIAHDGQISVISFEAPPSATR